LQGGEMELPALRREGWRVVPELPLLHPLREGDLLSWQLAFAAAAGQVEASSGALLRHSRGRAGRKAVHRLGEAGGRASRRAHVSAASPAAAGVRQRGGSGRRAAQVPQKVASTRSWSCGGCMKASNPG